MSHPPKAVTPEEKRLRRALPEAVLVHGRWDYTTRCATCGHGEAKAVEEWRVEDWDSGDVLAVAATAHEAVSRAVFLWGKRKARR